MLKLFTGLMAMAVVLLTPSSPRASAFAGSVIAYQPGEGFTPGYDDPAAALGEPSRVTPGEFGGPVDPFNPPYLAEQLASVGTGGSLTVEFATPITNDSANPFGLDFIIFGNAGFVITNGNFSGGGITDGTLFSSGDGTAEISVSTDGETYYRLSPGLAPPLDDLFPTDGSGNFHRPVNPRVTRTDLAGQGIAGIRQLYEGSAGGAAFDLTWARDEDGQPVDLDSIRFVQVDVLSGHMEIDGFASVEPALPSGIPDRRHEIDFETDPLAEGWQVIGSEDLFQWNETNSSVQVTWDSAKPNSYFALPLGLTLRRGDDFTISFTLDLESIAIGATPEKPYTFQIAAGLINLASATDPEMHRASGINPEHGPRNLVEFAYFPDSGFGATAAPTLVSQDNQLLFSSNHPVELLPGNSYQVEMTFSPSSQTLTTRMWENGEPFGAAPNNNLKPLVISHSFSDFAVNAFAISSYSDQGQDPQFAGSILARAQLDDVTIVLRNKPALTMTRDPGPTLQFPTQSGWNYFVERSSDTISWQEIAGPLSGGQTIQFADPQPLPESAIYRVRAEQAAGE